MIHAARLATSLVPVKLILFGPAALWGRRYSKRCERPFTDSHTPPQSISRIFGSRNQRATEVSFMKTPTLRRRQAPTPRYRRCGFTLIELLVVIAIIAILASML